MDDSLAKPTYRAVFERDDNDTWFVRVPDVQGVHSFGRTLARADRNIQEAIALVLDVDESSFDLTREVRLAPDAQTVVAEAQRYREIAALSQSMSSAARARAVDVLSAGTTSLSLRDIAELVGTSFQRIQQIRADQRPRRLGESGDDEEGRAEVVNLMTVLTTTVEAARRSQATAEADVQDWSELWTAVSRPSETLDRTDVLDFTEALTACLDAVRRNLKLIPWSVEAPVMEADARPRASYAVAEHGSSVVKGYGQDDSDSGDKARSTDSEAM
jgi:predicted RNase H-like HicB family nuclease